jgi:hypothetical protein
MARHVSVTVGSLPAVRSVTESVGATDSVTADLVLGGGGAITHGRQVNATNTGITGAGISAGSLTSNAGGTYSTNGQTITGYAFTGTVTLNGDNITLSGCTVTLSGSSSKGVIINGAGCIVEDCTITAPSGQSMYMGIHVSNGTNATIRRCDISRGENNMTIENGPTTVTESYLHDSSNASNPGGHRDCIEVYGGNDVTLNKNRLVHPTGETSVVNIAPWWGSTSVDSCTIDDNWIDGGMEHIIVDLQSTGTITNTRIRRNDFGGHTANGDYFALLDNDGRGTVGTEAALTSNPNAILYPPSGADANYWQDCTGLAPDRSGTIAT